MENYNFKQILLSVIGIGILITAVVGVSFAFFTYSKVGETNNVITTGNIVFSFNDAENNIVIENQFPKSASEANTEPTKPFVFSISGNVPVGTDSINYEVYAIKGDEPESIKELANENKPKTRFQDSDIKLYLTGRDEKDEYLTGEDKITIEDTYSHIESGGEAGNSTTGFKIASGTIPNDGVEHKHIYTLTMWVSDKVTISDTDYSKTYRASSKEENPKNVPPKCNDNQTEDKSCLKNETEDNRAVYSDLYYSLKIKVVAGDAIGKIFSPTD